MEIVIGVAAKVAEYTVAPIARPLINLWKYKSNLENLKKEVEKLEARRDSVQCLIKVGEEPLPHVKIWQDSVYSIINEVSGLVSEDNPEQQNMQCCKGFNYSNLKKCYQRRKTVPRKLKDVAELVLEAREFGQVSYLTIPEEPWLQSSEGYKAFVSRTSILKNIIDALSKPDVDVVGIYGMGGIGKTTLAKQVAREAIQDKLFNKIIFVEVSKTPDIKKVQGEIGSKLGLESREETESPERARRLYQQLKKDETTLLILDNIWESLNFETVGIPFKNDRKGLKLLLTARKINVLADGMNSLHNFHIEALNDEDAWSLFKNTAGTCVDRPDLHRVAVDVAKKCGGVPVAIVPIAKALSNKAIYEWRKVLWELRNPSSASFDGIAADVYLSIQLSYNYLETQELKDTFLLCSSMGSTYDASIEDLLRYGIGLGIFNRCNRMEEERDNVRSLVSRLKTSSLLVDAPKGRDFFFNTLSEIDDRFAMHDVVCDVARSIASRDKYVFNVNDDVIPRPWETGNTLRNCTSITLHEVGELSEDLQLVCPQLKFLYMKSKNFGSGIPDKFFKSMPILQVLHLIRMNLQPLLPTSLSGLVNLQTLCLERCALVGEIAPIGDLKNLEILSFRHSSIEELPETMCQLTKLRLLDLTHCSVLTVIPPNVISSFKKLEALYMSDTRKMKWEVEKSNNERRNASLDELEHLSNLTALEIKVPDVAMSRGLLSPKLERYNIIIGERSRSIPMEIHWNIGVKTSKCLELQLNTNENGVISQLKGIKQLVLDGVPGVVNILDDLDTKGFPELEYLTVKNNSHILHIVDTKSGDNVFSILDSLFLWNLINLKKICNVSLGVESNFRQLRTIRVGQCHKLIDIFSFEVDRVFQELEEFQVCDCENMEKIFDIGEQVSEIKFNKLRILRLKILPRLKSLCCNVKTSSPVLQLTSETKAKEIISEEPRPLFNDKVAFPKLEILNIENINVEMIWDNQLIQDSFSNLKSVKVKKCRKLLTVFSLHLCDMISSLESLNVEECESLEEIFDLKGVNFEERHSITVTQVGECQRLCFANLQYLNVSKCQSLKNLFSALITAKEGVVAEETLAIARFVFPKLTSLGLDMLPEFKSFYPGRHTMEWPMLNKLTMFRCGITKEGLVSRLLLSENQVKPPRISYGLTIHVERIWPGLLQTMDSWVQDLTVLIVYDCVNLKELFPSSMIELRDKEMRNMISFPKLGYLEMNHLENLTRLCSGCYIEFPSLKEFKISNCPELKTCIFNDKVAFSKLETLDIQNINVEMIWDNQLSTMSFVQTLTILIISNLSKLKRLWSINSITEFSSLKEMKIQSCPKLEFIFDNKEGVVAEEASATARLIFPKLTSLELYELPKLESFYSGRHTMECPVLDLLTMRQCGIHDIKEKGVRRQVLSKDQYNRRFQPSDSLEVVGWIGPNLLQNMWSWVQNITQLIVHDCSNFKELFPSSPVELREKEIKNTISLPNLTYLVMDDLENLTRLCSGYYIEFLSLIEFRICKCPKLKACIFDDKVGVASLEKIAVVQMDNLKMIWHNQLPEDLFPKLKSFEVNKCQELLTVFPSNMCRRISSLEYLTIDECKSLVEIFDLQGINSEERPSIGTTQTGEICSDDPQITFSFANLKNLKVTECQSLKNLFSASIVAKDGVRAIEAHPAAMFIFPKLKSLQLYKLLKLESFYPGRHTMECPVLDLLMMRQCGIHDIKEKGVRRQVLSKEQYNRRFQPSDSLEVVVGWIRLNLLQNMCFWVQNLTQLNVHDCGNFKELFLFSPIELREKEIKNTISFPKLTYLVMAHLENLTRLCSGYYIEFPSLIEFKICNCPKLKACIFDDKVGVASLEKIAVVQMDNLKMIWHNQLPEDSFPKLKSFEVNKCQELLTVFPSNMCRRISSLEYLTIDECKSLVEIFDLQGINSEERPSIGTTQTGEICSDDPQITFSFANLKNLKVTECQSLKNLFSASIVAKDGVRAIEAHPAAMFIFPKLKSLQLYKLLKLESFYPGRHTMECPVLDLLTMRQCGIHDIKEKGVRRQVLSKEQYNRRFQPSDSLKVVVGWIRPNLLQNMCFWVQNLTQLNVHDCGNFKELFLFSPIELREKEIKNTISFPKLTYLVMAHLENLTRLCSGYYIEFPSLIKFKICNCPKLKACIFDDKVGVASLEKIAVVQMDNLKMIWHNQLPEDSFPKLKSFEVNKCQELLTVFPSNMCRRISSLEYLTIDECKSLVEIFDLQGINSEERPSIGTTQTGEICSDDPQITFSFANLKNLKVTECQSLKNLFSASIVAKDGVRAIEAHPAAMFIFPKLSSLELHKLLKLESFYPGRHTMECPVLDLLTMHQCGFHDIKEKGVRRQVLSKEQYNRRFQPSDSLNVVVGWIRPNLLQNMCFWVQNLTRLIVHDCGNFKELFQFSPVELREKEINNTISFPKLTYLVMAHLENLTRLCSGYYIEFPSLIEFKICNCPKLKACIFDDKVGVASLEKIAVVQMDNLKMIWHNQLPEDSFPKLKSFEVNKCQELLAVFPSNMYRRISSLEFLIVDECKSLVEIFDLQGINLEERPSIGATQTGEFCCDEPQRTFSLANLKNLKVTECQSLKNLFSASIVAKDGVRAIEAPATVVFVFSKLTSLVLHKLPDLRTFYPGKYTVEAPALKMLKLHACGIQDIDHMCQMQQPFFLLVEKAFPCLEKLILPGKDLTIMLQEQDTKSFFRKFKILEIIDEFDEDHFFHDNQTVFCYFGDVKYMWKQNFKLDLVLPNFEDIRVKGCDSFISLMPPSASFQNLTSLTVDGCHTLEHILTFSVAKSLVKLVEMRISCCKKITEVVGNQGDVIEDKIIFSNLESLSLTTLPNLTSFCSCSCTLEFPFLESLYVLGCPNMKIFSQGNLTMQRLQNVKVNKKSIQLCPDVDLSTTLQKFLEKQKWQISTEDESDSSSD